MTHITDDVPLVRSEEVIMGVSAGLGFLGNSLAIYVLVIVLASDRGCTNLYALLNQSLIDLAASVLAVLCFLAPGVQRTAAHRNTNLFICYFWNSKLLFWAVVNASKLNLLWLVWERYRAAVNPFQYRQQKWQGWPWSLTLALLPWLAGFVLEGFSLAQHSVDPRDGTCHLGKFKRRAGKVAFSVAFLAFAFLLPLMLMAVAYLRIYRTLSASNKTERASLLPPKPRGRGVPGSGLRSRRIVLASLLTACLVFALLWLPNHVAYLLYQLNDNVHPNQRLYCASVCLVVMSTFANPVVYTLHYRQFRQGIWKALPCLASLGPETVRQNTQQRQRQR